MPNAQSNLKTIGILTNEFCKFGGPSLNGWWVIALAQNRVNIDFEVKSNIECQGQSPFRIIVILTKVVYSYGQNLVILALTGDELSRRQARDWHTVTHTHTDCR